MARAYPYTSLGKRNAVNDTINGRPVLVVFDENARMALPFDRRVGGSGSEQTLTFDIIGDGGFPFQLQDRETGTVWNLKGESVEGPLSGARLKPIATFSAFWFAWAAFNRNTEIYSAIQ